MINLVWFVFCRRGSTIADIDLQFSNESTPEEEQEALNAFTDDVVENDGTLGNFTVSEILTADSEMPCK